MTIEELLEKLDQQITFLSNSFKIPGMSKDDVAQELRLLVIKDHLEHSSEKYKEGWWFNRLKWFLINLQKRENKEPVNRSIRVEKFSE